MVIRLNTTRYFLG